VLLLILRLNSYERLIGRYERDAREKKSDPRVTGGPIAKRCRVRATCRGEADQNNEGAGSEEFYNKT